MTTFSDAGAVRLADRDYFDFVLAAAETACRRILAAVFLQDVRPSRDVRGQVLELTMALANRRRLGVDVRVLLTGHLSTPDIAVANLASGQLFEAYDVPHRRSFDISPDGRRGLHSKLVICDDVAVVGSQNWTDDAFAVNVEDAVAVTGPPVDHLAVEFDRLWSYGRGMPNAS